MSVLDFKEIPEAHEANGLQDSFELFAREFLSFVGYKVISDPDRGADGGVDLIVEERRIGVGGETVINWLVSCKHKAFTGKSVSPADDPNVRDRVEANECQGFMGFYSTIASTGLGGVLGGLKGKVETLVYDREKIEGALLHSAKGLELAERFFPKSIGAWKVSSPTPAQIFSEAASLKCRICSKELLEQEDKGVITFWRNMTRFQSGRGEKIKYVYWTCRGYCDRVLQQSVRATDDKLIDGWSDIADAMTPTVFLKWIMTIMNELHGDTEYSDESFEQLKDFLLNIFPYICRHLTDDEKERINMLMALPEFLGGFAKG